ncbi:hypothetical protein BB560_005797, partial [Smittium megazygosporum]
MDHFPRLPYIKISYKKSTPFSWNSTLPAFIQYVFQEDPTKFQNEIDQFSKLRNEIFSLSGNINSRNKLYRYLSQLNLLELRIPNKNKIKGATFTWFDSYTEKKDTLDELNFEKLCIQYNLAAVLANFYESHSSQAKFDEETPTEAASKEIKTLCTSFQCASYIFDSLFDNSSKYNAVDLHKDNLVLLSEITLAQAQECYVQKATLDKKRPSLIAKLCNEASLLYYSINKTYTNLFNSLDYSSDSSSLDPEALPKPWFILASVKAKIYASMAQYYEALNAQSKQNHGEAVSRFQSAYDKCKNAEEKLEDFNPSIFDDFEPLRIGLASGSVDSITETITSMMEHLKTQLDQATADNNLIYHDEEPQMTKLPAIGKLTLAEPQRLLDTLNEKDHSLIVGDDIFKNLIPITVHERASLYSEEVSKLIREQQENIDINDAELSDALGFMKISDILYQFQKFIEDPNYFISLEDSEFDELSTSLTEAMSESRDLHIIKDFFTQLSSLQVSSKAKLEGIKETLDKELALHGSNPELKSIANETESLSMSIQKANESDFSNNEQYKKYILPYLSHLENIEKCTSYVKSQLKSEISKEFSDIMSQSSKVGNLLDIDSNPELSLASILDNIRNLSEELEFIKNERSELLKKLRKASLEENISDILVLNEPINADSDKMIFEEELKKFSPYISGIEKLSLRQKDIIKLLAEQIKLMNDNSGTKNIYRQQKLVDETRAKIELDLLKACSLVKPTLDNIRDGIEFYTSLVSSLNKIYYRLEDISSKSSISLGPSANPTIPQPPHNISRGPSFNYTQQSAEDIPPRAEIELLSERFQRENSVNSKNSPYEHSFAPPPINSNLHDKNRVESPLPSYSYNSLAESNNRSIDTLNQYSDSTFSLSLMNEKHRKAIAMIDASLNMGRNDAANQQSYPQHSGGSFKGSNQMDQPSQINPTHDQSSFYQGNKTNQYFDGKDGIEASYSSNKSKSQEYFRSNAYGSNMQSSEPRTSIPTSAAHNDLKASNLYNNDRNAINSGGIPNERNTKSQLYDSPYDNASRPTNNYSINNASGNYAGASFGSSNQYPRVSGIQSTLDQFSNMERPFSQERGSGAPPNFPNKFIDSSQDPANKASGPNLQYDIR